MQTGAMIALAPADPAALALEGGEPAEELHVTLWFLGEAADIPPEVLQEILDEVEARAAELPVIEAQAFGAAVWNPNGDDPCCVLNVGGEGLYGRRALMGDVVDTARRDSGWEMPENHSPWAAHMCLAYSPDPASLIAAALERVGPVTLDRIRVAFGDDVHNFPLGAPADTGDEDEDAPEDEADETTDDDTTAVTAATRPTTGGRTMRRWSGVIAQEGVQTGDGRVIAEGALYWDDLPIPLRWAPEDEGGHFGAVTVGTIDTIERRGQDIYATGTIDDQGDHGTNVVRLMDEGMLRGVSIDPDDWETVVVDTTMTEADLAEIEDEIMVMLAAAGDPDPGDGPDAGVVLFEDEAGAVVERLVRARIRAATLVDIPAFAGAVVALDPAAGTTESDDVEALVASVIGSTDLPIADREHDWDAGAAAGRVFDMCSDGDSVDVDCVSRAFLYRDPDAESDTQAAYKLGFADVVNGQLEIIPRGVAATTGGRGVDAADIPSEDKDRIRSRICSLYDKIQAKYDDWPDCPFDSGDSDGESATTASSHSSHRGCSCGGTCGTCRPDAVVAAGGPTVPPADWFTDPALAEATPLTIDDDGRVFGHIATWGTCHTGSPAGACVQPPRSQANYAYFRTGVRETSAGDVPVGQITLGGGHADLHLSYRGAAEHYDDVAAAMADVAAGEDAHGIWVAGALRPGVTDEQIVALRAASPSGDWRNVGGQLELVAAHAVNSPGFPVARVASGRKVALVAAGVMAPRTAADADPAAMADTPAGISVEAMEAFGRAAATGFAQVLERREAAPHRRRLASLAADHANHRERVEAARQRRRLRRLA